MTLDELINALLEAKDHCIDGKSLVYVKGTHFSLCREIEKVEFDNNNVYINYE